MLNTVFEQRQIEIINWQHTLFQEGECYMAGWPIPYVTGSLQPQETFLNLPLSAWAGLSQLYPGSCERHSHMSFSPFHPTKIDWKSLQGSTFLLFLSRPTLASPGSTVFTFPCPFFLSSPCPPHPGNIQERAKVLTGSTISQQLNLYTTQSCKFHMFFLRCSLLQNTCYILDIFPHLKGFQVDTSTTYIGNRKGSGLLIVENYLPAAEARQSEMQSSERNSQCSIMRLSSVIQT